MEIDCAGCGVDARFDGDAEAAAAGWQWTDSGWLCPECRT